MVGIGIVGCGGMGRSLVDGIVKTEGAELRAAFDPEVEASRMVTSKYGGTVAPSREALLSRSDVDAVIVATPGYLHAEPVIAAARANKHVFCEKPFALNLADCDSMIRECRDAGVNLMVGQVLRLLPVFKESTRIVREELGPPVAMSAIRISGWRFKTGWRSSMETSGGMLLEVNVHEFDYLRHVCGEPVEVFARGGTFVHDFLDYEDTVIAIFRHESGAIGNLRLAASSTMGKYTGEIICEKGTLFFDNRSTSVSYRKMDDDEVVITRDQLPKWGGVEEETAEFVRSIEENRQPSISGEDGRAAVEMALAVRQSIREGVPVLLGSR